MPDTGGAAASALATDACFRWAKVGLCRLGGASPSGVFRLGWPCPVLRPGETPNPWHVSHIAAYEAAKTGWVRMKSNKAGGFYDRIEPKSPMPDPDWPDMTFADILQTAFNDDHIVDRDDHPALRRLLGAM